MSEDKTFALQGCPHYVREDAVDPMLYTAVHSCWTTDVCSEFPKCTCRWSRGAVREHTVDPTYTAVRSAHTNAWTWQRNGSSRAGTRTPDAWRVSAFHVCGLSTRLSTRIRMSFIARYIYRYEEFVIVTEATAAQQNDSDRTKKHR